MKYGKVDVPYSVCWSGEYEFTVGQCDYVPGHRALLQKVAPGEGKPEFSHPHLIRQREVISKCQCSVCQVSLDKRTKVSLGESRFVKVNGKSYPVPVIVEPFACKECAYKAVRDCPHLVEAAKSGTLSIRHVTQFDIVAQVLSPDAVAQFAGVREGGVIGHLKLQLLQFKRKDLDWLRKAHA